MRPTAPQVIAMVLPGEKINLVAGVMQVFDNFFEVFQLKALTHF